MRLTELMKITAEDEDVRIANVDSKFSHSYNPSDVLAMLEFLNFDLEVKKIMVSQGELVLSIEPLADL